MPIPSQQSRQDRRANQIEACITGAGLLPSACVPLLAAAAASATPREDKESDCESDVTTASLDSYLSRTPLAGNGYVLLGFGRDYNVDPRFVVALAGAETGFGRNITWGSNNAWNWGWNSGNPKNSPFISLAYGIQVVTSGARRLYLNQGRTTTASFYSKYCVGPDCANGLNNINNFMAQQGGNANDLTFPCRKE